MPYKGKQKGNTKNQFSAFFKITEKGLVKESIALIVSYINLFSVLSATEIVTL